MIKGVYAHFSQLVPDSSSGIRRIEESIKALSDANFNFIIPLAKDTKGLVNYNSKIIKGRIFKNIDLLKEVTKISHDYGIKVYPWVCAFSDGERKPSEILARHPDWMFVDKDGKRRGYICPSSKEGKEYILSIIKEIIDNYDVDGISLDYVRTPGGPCYCDRCRSEYKRVFGSDPSKIKIPSKDWTMWEEFQRNNITKFIEEANRLVRKRGLKISSYVWTSTSRYTVAQDWPLWTRMGLLDFLIPTGYVYSLDLFKRIASDALTIAGDVPAYICIGIRTSHGFIERPEDLVDYIQITKRVGLKGYVFFTLSALLPFLDKVKNYLG